MGLFPASPHRGTPADENCDLSSQDPFSSLASDLPGLYTCHTRYLPAPRMQVPKCQSTKVPKHLSMENQSDSAD
jgi:hypothetical protein